MERIESRISTSSAEFRHNREIMEAQAGKLRAVIEKVREGGPENARRRHIERGKLLVREYRDRDRAYPGARGGNRRQRRDGQGRHLLSDHGEEASAGAGNRD